MDLHVAFSFRNKQSLCNVFIDSSATPCYVFIDLKDRELIQEFGEEITIKTDFDIRLPKQDDYPALIALRDAIFISLTELPAFIAKRRTLVSV